MKATCASCLSPIVKGQRAKIVGSEVFHKACSPAGSALARATATIASQKITIRDAHRELDRLKAELEIARQNTAAAQRDARAAHDHADNLARAREHERDQLLRADRAARANRAELEAEIRRSGQLATTLASTEMQLAAVTTELSIVKAMAAQPPPAPVAVPAAPDPAPDRDAAEIRGTLLELD